MGNVNILHGDVETLHGNVVTLTDALDTLETTVGSQGGLIQGSYGAGYAGKSWVNDKDYASEGYVDSIIVTTGAINILIGAGIDSALIAFSAGAMTAQINAKNAIQDVYTEATYVKKPFDWGTYVPLDSSGFATGDPTTLKSYTDRKILDISGLRIEDLKNGISSDL